MFLGARRRQQRRSAPTKRRYTTQEMLPQLAWISTGVQDSDIDPEETRVICLNGLDICLGKTSSGKLFAVGDKAPPTGLSFGLGCQIAGDTIRDVQYGNVWNVFDGVPEEPWCPNPPIVGSVVALVAGGPQCIGVYELRKPFFGGAVEVLLDINAKRAYEAQYWKGLLDAQGKEDGAYN